MLKAKELLESGAIGKPYFVQANYWESFGQATFLEDLEGQMEAGGNWRYQPELSGGGILMDGATHWVRPMRIWYISPLILNSGIFCAREKFLYKLLHQKKKKKKMFGHDNTDYCIPCVVITKLKKKGERIFFSNESY